MKTIKVLFFMIVFTSLNACDSSQPAPTPTATNGQITPLGIPPSEINAMATIFVSEETAAPSITFPPPSATLTPEEMLEMPILTSSPLTITIVFDNNTSDSRLTSSWGFSALVEYRGHILLFDTGGDGRLLLDNMRILGIDPLEIDSVVLSHAHDDHTGGLTALMNTGTTPEIYLLPSFPTALKYLAEQYTQVSEVSPGQSIAEGIWTTGEMGTSIPEQALIIRTAQGLVIITGCAHPGIVAMVERAQELFQEPVRLVLGGFHLGSSSEAEIDAILTDFRRLGIQQAAPCHCTGEQAIRMFAADYGEDFIPVGVGSIINLDTAGQ